MASTRSSRAAAGIGEHAVGVRVNRSMLGAAIVVLLASGLMGCKGHTGGLTPGRAIGRAAGAIATAAAAGIASGAAARRNRDRSGEPGWGDESVPPHSFRREPDGAPLRLVSMPTGDAALAPEQIVCRDASDCVPVAATGCQVVAVRRERAEEVAMAECDEPASSYVPRCVHDLCRLESLSPEEVESIRVREASRDDDPLREPTSGGEVPPPPPGYE